jgi:hypothetical protein
LVLGKVGGVGGGDGRPGGGPGAGAGDGAEDAGEGELPEGEEGNQAGHGLAKVEGEARAVGAAGGTTLAELHDGEEDKEGDDGDVLHEQDAEAGAAEELAELPLLLQDLEDEGGGGEAERRADDEGLVQPAHLDDVGAGVQEVLEEVQPADEGDGSEAEGGDGDLEGPETEGILCETP